MGETLAAAARKTNDAKVLKKLGVKTRLLSVPDTLPALKKGIIDAAEITSPDRDINFGFHKITKYNYYPSWFQQTGPGELILNKKIWEGLSKTAQSIINTTCDQIYFATAVDMFCCLRKCYANLTPSLRHPYAKLESSCLRHGLRPAYATICPDPG